MHSGVYSFEQVHFFHQYLGLTVEQADYTCLKFKKNRGMTISSKYLSIIVLFFAAALLYLLQSEIGM